MRFINRLVLGDAKKSYAQCGEDLIANFILDALKILKPCYLDIGAYHPTRLSNTYLLYRKGCHGVCVEPDPDLYDQIKSKRKRDVCLNVGIGTGQEAHADFYVMSSKTLNTFSKEEAERYQSYGSERIVKVIQIPLVSVNNVIQEYFSDCPNFVSLDAEGLDRPILKTFNFSRFRPEIFCIETLTYAEDKSERKISEIIDLMIKEGYFVCADTYINTIFVEKEAWTNR
ncbi:MAG: FkbM family methyltransferase [Deltaproteobacteria bacterium]|jgi:FkbM family methyltransferase